MSIGQNVFEEYFVEKDQISCKKEGKGTVFGNGLGDAALIACKESDECSSVIHDTCAKDDKYELCNGVKFEEYGDKRALGFHNIWIDKTFRLDNNL